MSSRCRDGYKPPIWRSRTSAMLIAAPAENPAILERWERCGRPSLKQLVGNQQSNTINSHVGLGPYDHRTCHQQSSSCFMILPHESFLTSCYAESTGVGCATCYLGELHVRTLGLTMPRLPRNKRVKPNTCNGDRHPAIVETKWRTSQFKFQIKIWNHKKQGLYYIYLSFIPVGPNMY